MKGNIHFIWITTWKISAECGKQINSTEIKSFKLSVGIREKGLMPRKLKLGEYAGILSLQ